MKELKIIECPRDAMQGIKTFIPTEIKIAYIQSLLRVGFDTIDFGSFVSTKSIPQMEDTAAVLSGLDLSNSKSKLLAIIANTQGAREAVKHQAISYLGFPFSISENFQMRNTHKTISESIVCLQEIMKLAYQNNKEVVVYLSMGFGNPYGDPWNVNIVRQWVEKLSNLGVKIISLSDTIACSTPEIIGDLFGDLIPMYKEIEFGAHFHTKFDKWHEKIDAAYLSGCRRFDGAIQGFGGCPMAHNVLIGNMPTEKLITYFNANKEPMSLNAMNFESAYNATSKVFKNYF